MESKLKELNEIYADIQDLEFPEKYKQVWSLREQIKSVLEEWHTAEPANGEVILRLAIAFFLLDEAEIALSYLDLIPAHHLLYPHALLIKAVVQKTLYPLEEQEYRVLIGTSQRTLDPEMKSMLLYAASFHWQLTPVQERELLFQSIKLHQKHVLNFKKMAAIYFEEKNNDQVKRCVVKAMRNIIEMSSRSTEGDITNPEEFIDKNIKGIHLTRVQLARLIDLIDPRAQLAYGERIRKELHDEFKIIH